MKISKIKEVYQVNVEISVKGKNGSDENSEILYCMKIGGKWKVYAPGIDSVF